MVPNEIIVNVKGYKMWVYKTKRLFTNIGVKAICGCLVILTASIGFVALQQYESEKERIAAERAEQARFHTFDVPLLGTVKIEK